jgi:ribosomal protein S18 acetylase RimI-like enzyme
MNSVSSVLSANASVFESGFERLKQPGWWALKHIQPPKPGTMYLNDLKNRRKRVDEDYFAESDLVHPLPISRSPATLDTAQTLLYSKHFANRIPNVSALLPSQAEATPTTVKAAQEIKRKLVERLLRVDSKLLQEALANSPAPPFQSVACADYPRPKEMELKMSDCRDLTHTPSLKELRRLHKVAKPANYVRASPHENELLEMCLRISDPDATLNRFKRKLVMRRMKRRVGLCIFDIDAFMYRYLKSNDPLAFPNVGTLSHVPVDNSADDDKTFYDIPYRRDPCLSFLAKLNGTSCVVPQYPSELVSPFTGLRLARFYHREYVIRPQKLRLLDELKQHFSNDDSAAAPIDFMPVRREWLSQTNRLLQEFFWPAVDMTEALDYPDFGIIVLFQKLVIGCAFVTPDGYMTYFMIHPEWADSGLGSILLYILLSKVAPPHLDLTLHVSATNPALILYQKFGFKAEEYVVNFYDKYFKSSSGLSGALNTYSKNAYYLRYRR